jgi:hypothetical protein
MVAVCLGKLSFQCLRQGSPYVSCGYGSEIFYPRVEVDLTIALLKWTGCPFLAVMNKRHDNSFAR